MPCPLIWNGRMVEWEKRAGNSIALKKKKDGEWEK